MQVRIVQRSVRRVVTESDEPFALEALTYRRFRSTYEAAETGALLAREWVDKLLGRANPT
jgi:hypothetical protein